MIRRRFRVILTGYYLASLLYIYTYTSIIYIYNIGLVDYLEPPSRGQGYSSLKLM